MSSWALVPIPLLVIIILTFSRTFADDAHMLQTAHIINIVNIFDKEYSTAQIYWVLPYQVHLNKSSFQKF